ncbi:MAG: NYN domain-containing protein [Alphaproteobacteria bacterium]|nr:NYN domain-containing protein [Alphaproteobacteria bacterium]MDA8032097.1 NYN domain-containing protein [Alphaproteobacteria bacterium]
MKTIVYVDALNLYYGSLRHKGGDRYKWLDLMRLFQLLLPRHQIIRIHYFTAIVEKTDSDPEIRRRQRTYIGALERHIPEMEVHYGRFRRDRVLMENAEPPPPMCKVFRDREKKTDVNLAVRLLDDAWTRAHNCAVIVSNDSDLSGAMDVFKKRFPEKRLGLIFPGERTKMVQIPHDLKEHADFIRKIRRRELKNSQLPNPIPGTKISKPDAW